MNWSLTGFFKGTSNWFQSLAELYEGTPWGIFLYSGMVLFLTALLSGVIGFEREKNGFAAGLRTHILVALGSCLFMIVSKYGFKELANPGDPSRIAAQVVTGIGFIGAGAIMKNGLEIKGLTTASTLWIVAGIGMCMGAGLVLEAILVTFLAFLILVILKILEKRVRKNVAYIAYLVPKEQMTLARASKICDTLNLPIKDIDISKDMEGNIKCQRVVLTLKIKQHLDVVQAIEAINIEIEPLRIEELK